MDISSTTSSAATITQPEQQVSPQTQKSVQSESSFKEEMNKAEENTQNTNQLKDKHNKPVALKNKDIADSLESDLLNFNQAIPANIQLMQNNLLNETLDTNIQTLMDANRQLAHISLINNASQVPAKVDYTNIEMGTDDAKFFADLVQDTDKTLQNVAADLQGEVEQNVQQAAKNVKVSATLMNALNEAVKTNQPFRINFDKDVSVIIKVDKDGAVSATFIPGDKAVEEYLKQNISFLRQRFDEQELSYRDLSYSRQKQNQEQNRRNNKENDHE